MKDLDWLGIDWNEGPEDGSNGGGEHGPYLQSQRLPIYQKELDRLLAEGKAYYAFDTPEELDAKRTAARAAKETYRYDGAARSLPPEEVQAKLDAGLPAVVRFRAPLEPVTIIDEVLGEAVLPAGELDDFVIRKADGFPTYHFAVVVDDALMEVTHVLRAQEHFSNTAKHMLLQDALGYSRPVYGHLSIIQNPDGSKMSKRDKDKVLRAALRELGLSEIPESLGCSGEEFQRWMGDRPSSSNCRSWKRSPTIFVLNFRKSTFLILGVPDTCPRSCAIFSPSTVGIPAKTLRSSTTLFLRSTLIFREFIRRRRSSTVRTARIQS